MQRLLSLAIIFSVIFMTGANADEMHYIAGLNNPKYHHIESNTLGRPFHLFVRLPENYKETERDYPTVYLLDGDLTFAVLAGYYRYLRLGEEVPDSIIVGITYGADDFQSGNFRSTDFTAAAPDRDFWGGAPDFQRFLEDEAMPLIEKNYRSDAQHRIIFGQSLSGQFVLYTALTRPDLFWGHIASNPALHRNLPFFLEYHGDVKDVFAKLFVSSGANDDEQFRKPAVAWIEHWSSENETPWTLKAVTLEDETHFSAAPSAFREGMKWLFADE